MDRHLGILLCFASLAIEKKRVLVSLASSPPVWVLGLMPWVYIKKVVVFWGTLVPASSCSLVCRGFRYGGNRFSPRRAVRDRTVSVSFLLLPQLAGPLPFSPFELCCKVRGKTLVFPL